MAEINVLAEKYQKFNDGISQQKPEDVTDKLKQSISFQLFSMEEIGLTTQDRWDASPEYWKNKVFLAKQNIEEPETNNVSGYNGDNGLYRVHQTDLALKRMSIMTFPCLGFWNAFVPCPVLGYGWNNGETRISWDVIPTDGRVSYDSSVCVDSNTHHNSVTFDMNTKRKMISNIQTVVYDYTDSETPTLTGNAGECEDNYKEKTVSAGARISMTTGISNIDLN